MAGLQPEEHAVVGGEWRVDRDDGDTQRDPFRGVMCPACFLARLLGSARRSRRCARSVGELPRGLSGSTDRPVQVEPEFGEEPHAVWKAAVGGDFEFVVEQLIGGGESGPERRYQGPSVGVPSPNSTSSWRWDASSWAVPASPLL